MSTIRCEVVALTDVRPHPDAERLDLATIKGWQMVVPKGLYADGDRVVYFEAGTVLPASLAEKLNVTNYLKNKLDINGERVLVVGQARLRGEPSFGLAAPLDDPSWQVGDDVAAHYGAVKFQPPVKTSAGDADVDHPLFPAYTDIENMRNFPDVLEDGEAIVVTEKLHGTNARVGFVREDGVIVSMAGSRTLRRKDPGEDLRHANTYWLAWTKQPVVNLMSDLAIAGHDQVLLFGEVYGRGVQSYDYGTGARDFRAFDLLVDGRYLDDERKAELFAKHGIETVPELYRGPFSLAKVKDLSDGPSVVGGAHGREGTVTRVLRERTHPKLGRVILKYIGDTYLFGKKGGGAEDFTDQ